MALAGIPKLLWISDDPAPQNVRAATGDSWELTPYLRGKPLRRQLNSAGLALISPNGASNGARYLRDLLRELDQSSAVALFLLPAQAEAGWKVLSRRKGQFLCVRRDASAEEISATLAAAAALQPTIRKLHRELVAARTINASVVGSVEELDEEMRLGARLQRDFLPRRLPEIGPVRFGVLYRPASWVSGDIYDVIRLDETHIGFYVVDAVGHGMPAALLTMFIKKALQTKRISGKEYQILPPDVSLAELNSDMCQQNLSSCQFCTAIYCVLDIAGMTLTYARAGHPEAILMRNGGDTETLSAAGTLLGIFPDEKFESRQVKLFPGDRLLLYTDGAESALLKSPADRPGTLDNVGALWAGVSREEMLLRLTGDLETQRQEGSLCDDATIVVMDIEK